MPILSVRDMVMVALFTSLTVAVSFFTRFSSGIIPFSLMPLMAMLAGNVLGGRMGALSIFLYVLLGLCGIPVFASPPFAGLAYVFQPSFGFLAGFVAAAYIIGKMTEMQPKTIRGYFYANIIGIIIINIFGLGYFWLLYNCLFKSPISFFKIIRIGLLPFILPDLAKGLLAGFLGINIHKRLHIERTKKED